jgi:hypothetical protein
MRGSQSRFDFRRCVKPIVLATAVAVLAAVSAVVPELFATLTHSTQEMLVERFLWLVLILYWVSLALAIPGGSILTIAMVRARGGSVKRPTAARLLLLCASTLVCLGFIEAASAVWLAWTHRFPDLPTQFKVSPSDELRIAVIGESSARGQPYHDWLSIGPIVAWKLQAALPGRVVVADVLAREGATLEEMHQKLERIGRRPDALIIYAGHNEFQARFPWDQDGTRPGGILPYAIEVVMQDGLGSPLFRCVSEAVAKYRVMAPPRVIQRGPIEPPIVRRAESERILDEFGRRLEAIVSWCERIGAEPVLLIPADNQSGYEPNRSVLPESVSPEERRAFARDWLAARSNESDPAPAMDRYRALIARYPGFAEAHFRLARLLEHSGQYIEAARDYRLARDLDGFPQRCQTSFKDAYRRVAARHACILIDGPAELQALSPHGIVGDLMINDGHHPSLRGHIALAEAVLRELRGRQAFGWSHGTAPVIDVAECASHFGIDNQAWAKISANVSMFYIITAIIRHDASERLRKAALYHHAADQIAAGTLASDLGIAGIGLPASSNQSNPPRHNHAAGAAASPPPSASAPVGSSTTPRLPGMADHTTAVKKVQPATNDGSPTIPSTKVQW